MASHWPFKHLQLKLWAKEGPGVKLAVWLPTTRSRELTFSWRPNWECDTTLKSSRRELQLWYRTRPNPSLGRGVMAVQSSESPAGTLSRLHFGSPNKMCHSDVVTRSQVTGWNPLEGFTKSSCGKLNLIARSRLPTLEKGRGSSWEPRD
jgi:hypothetical protein